MSAAAGAGRRAWDALVAAHGAIARGSEHEALARLATAPGGRLRPAELARAVGLTRSGVTRLVQRLERAGLVERSDCPSDLRGSFIVVTAAGAAAAERHVAALDARFAARFSEAELETLAALLGRLRTAAPG
jgi:DNA-binding MarR family transcriptional regulator